MSLSEKLKTHRDWLVARQRHRVGDWNQQIEEACFAVNNAITLETAFNLAVKLLEARAGLYTFEEQRLIIKMMKLIADTKEKTA